MNGRRRAVAILACVAGLWLSADARAAEVKVFARWSLDTELRPYAHVVKLQLMKKDGADWRPVELPFQVTPALEDPTSYELRVKIGEVEDLVPVTPKADGLGDEDDPEEKGRAGSVRLLLGDHVPSADAVYTLAVQGDAIEVVVDGQKSLLPAQESTLNAKDLEINQTFLEPMTVRSKIEIEGGSGGGVLQARLEYGVDRFADQDWLSLQARGTADVNFQASQRDEFFNSLTGELRFYHATLWNLFVLEQGRYLEIDAHGRAEADQTVDNADMLGGLRLSAYTKDPISGFLSTLFVPRNRQTGLPEEAVVSPLLTFACDYVSEVADDRDARGASSKPDTGDGGNARLEAGLFWSMPLARGFAIEGSSALGTLGGLVAGPFGGSTPDVDALFELHGWYDAASEEFYDQSKISLAFSRRAPGKVKTSVLLTWARGEAAPNFDDVSALLAGLRVGF